MDYDYIKKQDKEVYDAIMGEEEREAEGIELIPSENYVSRAVREANSSIFTNKYSEGYAGKRYYGGQTYTDIVETIAVERAKKLFGAGFANVQSHAGAPANVAMYFALLEPGDTVMGMDLSHGGHLTHGNPANFSGKLYQFSQYGVREDNGLIDYDELAAVAQREKPRMITVGASAYSRTIDFARMGEIARGVGALLFADIAHIAGLVAAGLHPSPVPHADFVTTTTHKTLRGPRGGLILCRAVHAKVLDSAVFPGAQGGPLMHVIAAKAVCFGECLKPEFKEYSAQIIRNARAFAAAMAARGYKIVSGGTDNHLFLADLRANLPDLAAKKAQETLDLANITCNKNTVPFETRSPFQASGLRLGTPAVTTRGMVEADMEEIAALIDAVLRAIGTERQDGVVAETKERVVKFMARFPLPYKL